MPRRGGEKSPLWALVGVAGLGAVLRGWPLLAYGTYGARPDYDDGVNFTAAALLTHGVLPYKDFFYAHPPGGLLFLAPLGALTRVLAPNQAFALAGVMIVAVGALTTFLLGRLGWKLWGPAGGIAAALLYAVHPEVLVAERTTFMEPVLNLACIALASAWLTGNDEEVLHRRALVAGALGGAALTAKAWGLAWVLAAILAVPLANRWRTLARFAAGAAAAALVITLPFALPALGDFVRDTVFFHLWRPPDGTLSIAGRLHEVLGFLPGSWNVAEGRHAATSVLAMGGIAVAVVRARRPQCRGERFFLGAYALTLGMFLTGQTYFTHYNAHLALAETALAGLFASVVWRWATGVSRRLVPALLAALLLVPALLSMEEGLDDARQQSPELVALAAELRRLPEDGGCLFMFEPTWGVAGGRLPPTVEGAPVLVDSYGAMVFRAVRDGTRFPDMSRVFLDEGSQPEAREAMAACRFVVIGGRGDLQLSEETKAWFRERFVPRQEGASPIQIWERAVP